jgi:drug/metabolite transporter (DMT)-like permease
VNPRKYLVLASVMVLGACGDVSLSRGMKSVGSISLHDWTRIFAALMNPWVLAGITLLLGFMATYLTALSWADLTFVLPATALSYILLAGLSRLFLHENVTSKRWLGIALITVGVGFVASGPSLTATPGTPESDAPESRESRGPGPKEYKAVAVEGEP